MAKLTRKSEKLLTPTHFDLFDVMSSKERIFITLSMDIYSGEPYDSHCKWMCRSVVPIVDRDE